MAKKSEVNTSELDAKLKSMLGLASEGDLKTALTAGATVILNQAKINTPVLSGNLRRSERIGEFSHKNNSASIKVGTNVEYAPYVEFGTIYQQAQPYLRPAFDEKKSEALLLAKQALLELLEAKIK